MVVIANGHISLKKIDWDLICFAYLIISRNASLEPNFRSHSLLFVLASYLLPKYTVQRSKVAELDFYNGTVPVADTGKFARQAYRLQICSQRWNVCVLVY